MARIEMSRDLGLCYNVTGAGMFIAGILPFIEAPDGQIRSVFGCVALTGALISLSGLWPLVKELIRRVGEWKSLRDSEQQPSSGQSS
jgi:hypothetical protein